MYQETSEIEIYNLVGLLHVVLFQGSHRLEKFLTIEGFIELFWPYILSLEKYLKMEAVLEKILANEVCLENF